MCLSMIFLESRCPYQAFIAAIANLPENPVLQQGNNGFMLLCNKILVHPSNLIVDTVQYIGLTQA